MSFQSTKVIELGSVAFRQWRATHSHCRHCHGYFLKAKFWFSSEHLDDKNWVADFGSFKGLKEKLEWQFDHKTVVAEDDPALELFKELNNVGAIELRILPAVGAERFAELCFNLANEYVKNLTQGHVQCIKVEVFEHEKNSAIYER